MKTLVTLLLIFVIHSSASAPVLPNPVLYFLGQEFLTINGKQVTRYNFDVFNKGDYPDDLFAASPNLPPCGTNTKAARTWVDIYDQSGKRLNGFCALGRSQARHARRLPGPLGEALRYCRARTDRGRSGESDVVAGSRSRARPAACVRRR